MVNRSKLGQTLVSITGITLSYVLYDIRLEKLMKVPRIDEQGEKHFFQQAFAISLTQNIFAFTLALIVNKIYYGTTKSKMNLKTEISVGAFNFTSVFMATQALNYIPFPLQTITKSSKAVAILIMSYLLGSKNEYSLMQYFSGGVITSGLILFNLSKNEKFSIFDSENSNLLGVSLVFVSLFCDGLLGNIQTKAKKTFQPNQWDQMQSLNKWAGILCFIVSILSGQLMEFIAFTKEHPSVIQDLVLLGLTGTLGQIFIFYTLFHFNPLVLSLITTTRKFITIIMSIIIYNHQLNPQQWIAIFMVFGGLFVEIFSKPSIAKNANKILKPVDIDDIAHVEKAKQE